MTANRPLRALRLPALLLLLALVLPACARFRASASPANAQPRSVSGTVRHGERVTVPYGTVQEWDILVSPAQMGTEEPRSEADNRLLAFRVLATVYDDRSWTVTAQYRFAYSPNESDIHWVPGTAHYLLVRQ
ncbi:MAG TPA: hypothetical protein VFQ45_21320 [Longimicrobium sp.]|nr:hypothetical protein [Longimicrobium sp.]